MNKYLKMRDENQKKISNFNMFFAFSKEQFEEGLEKMKLTEKEIEKLVSIGGGGYILKKDREKFDLMFEEIQKSQDKAIENDISGENFIFDMFKYELNNHEYSYTWEIDETLEVLGITKKEINKKSNLLNGLNLAIESIKKYQEEIDEKEEKERKNKK